MDLCVFKQDYAMTTDIFNGNEMINRLTHGYLHASDRFGLDVVVLALSALVAIGLGVFSMRRGITS